MTDPKSIQAFIDSRPTAARSFWQKLRNAFKQLRKKIDGTSAAEKKILRRMSTAERLWADAFHEASQRANGTQSNESKPSKTKARKPETTKSLTKKSRQNTRYSTKKKAAKNGSSYDFTKSFAQQIDDWIAGNFPERDNLMIGGTPQVFQNIGFNALPMTIDQTHVGYAINGTKNADHTIGEKMLKQLPQAMEHPVAVITSATQPNTSVVALLPFTHNGNTVIAPVVIDGYAKQNNVLLDSNAVTSIHGRSNAIVKLLADALNNYANGQNTLFYWNKKQAIALLQKARVIMPKDSAQIHDGYITSIRDAGSPVKPKLKNVTESVQFKRWFGNWIGNPEKASKIVNADGSPKIMYHQTDADFSVFRTESTGAGRGDAILPDGAFFKSSDTDIGVSGQKQMQVYLNVRNPLRLKDRASAQAYWEKHVAGYKELMQEAQRVDALYKLRMERAEAEEDARYAELWQQWKNGEISEEQYQSGIEEDVSEKILQEWKQEEQRITQQAKQLLNDYMHNSKYDGIILAQDEGSFGRSTDSVIAFSPNQVKSATDNVGTFDRGNADIRYSVKKKAANAGRLSAEAERSGRTVSGEDAFKEDKYYQRRLDQWEELRDGTRIKVGIVQENSALNKVGIPAERVFYDISKIRKTMDKHGNQLSIRELKQIPALLGDPIVITEYEGAPNTVNVYGNLFTAKGAPIVVGMVVHTDIDGSTLISNIRTVHPRSNYAKQITDASVLYLNEDKKRTRTWFHVCDNLKVPLDGTKFGFIRSITYQDTKINRYSVKSRSARS